MREKRNRRTRAFWLGFLCDVLVMFGGLIFGFVWFLVVGILSGIALDIRGAGVLPHLMIDIAFIAADVGCSVLFIACFLAWRKRVRAGFFKAGALV